MHPPCLLHPLSFSPSIVDLASPSGVAPTRQDTRGTPGDSMDELFTRLCRSVKASHPAWLQGHAALLTRITTKRKRRSSQQSPYLRLAERVLFTGLLWRIILSGGIRKRIIPRRLSSISIIMPFTAFERRYYDSVATNLGTLEALDFRTHTKIIKIRYFYCTNGAIQSIHRIFKVFAFYIFLLCEVRHVLTNSPIVWPKVSR